MRAVAWGTSAVGVGVSVGDGVMVGEGVIVAVKVGAGEGVIVSATVEVGAGVAVAGSLSRIAVGSGWDWKEAIKGTCKEHAVDIMEVMTTSQSSSLLRGCFFIMYTIHTWNHSPRQC